MKGGELILYINYKDEQRAKNLKFHKYTQKGRCVWVD